MNRPAILSVDEALAQLLDGARPVSGTETIPTMSANGRVLAQSLTSSLDVPDHDNSAMDGYAVRVADCRPGVRLRVSQRIAAGQVARPLEAGTAARIFTGAPMPPGADAIVMQEETKQDGDIVVLERAPQKGEWVRTVGEDIRKGSTILDVGTKMRPQETGLAASVGIANALVYRRVKVALFMTGDELVMPGEPLPPGKIYNSSRFTLSGMLRELRCDVTDLGIVPDTLAATREFLRRAADGHDLVVTSGGMSVGEEDHVKAAVEAEGRLDMWRIAMKPGKPLAFGQVRRPDNQTSASFIGLPGNPVSSFVCLMLFVRPFVLRSQGVRNVMPKSYRLRADFDWPKPDARQEFLRVRLNASGGLDLFVNQSSHVLTSTVWGDGLLDNPPRTAINRGDMVRFLPFSELSR